MPRARRALQALANEYPDDVAQVYFGSIVNALEGRSTVPFDGHEAALQARQALSHEVQLAVARAFPGQSGTTCPAPLWAELAGRAAALPFRADHADAHAAPLFLLAGRWAEAFRFQPRFTTSFRLATLGLICPRCSYFNYLRNLVHFIRRVA